jgi:hypothetical protein
LKALREHSATLTRQHGHCCYLSLHSKPSFRNGVFFFRNCISRQYAKCFARIQETHGTSNFMASDL